MDAHFASDLRKFLTEHSSPYCLVDFGNLQVWPDVNVLTIITHFCKEQLLRPAEVFIVSEEKSTAEKFLKECIAKPDENKQYVPIDFFGPASWNLRSVEYKELWDKIKYPCIPLGDISENTQGIKTGNNEIFTVTTEDMEKYQLDKDWLLPIVHPTNIQRYGLLDPGEYVIYTDGSRGITTSVNIKNYLQTHKNTLEKRAECNKGMYPWWRLQRPRDSRLLFSSERLLVPLYSTHNRFCATDVPYVGMTDLYIVVPTDYQLFWLPAYRTLGPDEVSRPRPLRRPSSSPSWAPSWAPASCHPRWSRRASCPCSGSPGGAAPRYNISTTHRGLSAAPLR